MKESNQFNVLSSIGTFKNYLVRKCFQQWMHNVRYKLYCQQRKKLASHLFLGMESFCAPLLEIKKSTLEMDEVALLDVQGQKNGNAAFESGAFIDLQASKRTQATKEFEASMDKMQATVQRVCTDVRNLARTKDAYGSLDAYDMNSVNEKAKSMQQMKQEEADRRGLIQRSENEARMLVDFIRLMDYVVVSHLVDHVLNTLAVFLEEILKVRKVGLFQTDIQFSETTTSFFPAENDILGMVKQLIDATIHTVTQVSRIIYTQPFASVMASVIKKGPNVGLIIQTGRRFLELEAAIEQKIKLDFVEADEYVVMFDTVRPVFNFDQAWDLDEYSQREHTLETHKETMAMMLEWDRELEKMRVGGAIGILHVESRKLKNRLVPMNQEKMELVKGLLNDLAHNKCKTQLDNLRTRIESMQQRPHQLKVFAGHLEELN
jgi:dynein heavy chain